MCAGDLNVELLEGGVGTMEFPAAFFQEETRCDFLISSMMKRAWAAELEVLQVVAELCERNGLQYFADWGGQASGVYSVG